MQASEKAALWREGIIAPWYLRLSQLDLYDLLLRESSTLRQSSSFAASE